MRRLRIAAIGCLAWILAAAIGLSAEERRDGTARTLPSEVSDEGQLWTTQWSFEKVNVATLASRLKTIGVDLGLDLRGVVTADLKVGVPWRSPGDRAAYRFQGKLTSPRLVVDRVELQNLVTIVDYRDGVLKMTKLSSSILNDQGGSGGEFTGEAALKLLPRENATAELAITDLPLAPVSDLLSKLLGAGSNLVAQRGKASGQIRFSAPLDKIGDLASYRLDGTLACSDVKVAGIPSLDIKIGQVDVRDARLSVHELDVSTRKPRNAASDIRVLGKADLPLSGQGAFSAELLGDNLPLAEIAALLIPSSGSSGFSVATGKIDFRVRGVGELKAVADDTKWTVEGSVASPSLQLAGIDVGVLEHRIRFTSRRFEMQPLNEALPLPKAIKINQIATQHRLTSEALLLKSFDASVFGGNVKGSGAWPREEKGDLVFNASADAMQPVVRLPFYGKLSPPLTASLSGEASWRVPIRQLQEPSAHRGTGSLTASNIRVGLEPIGELRTNVSATPESFSLESKGRLFDGSVEVVSKATLRSTSSWSDVAKQLKAARLKFNKVSFGSIIDLLAGNSNGFSGRASGKVVVTPSDTDTVPSMSVSAELSRVRHNASFLSNKLTLNGLLKDGVVTIREMGGDFAGGSLQSSGRIHLVDRENRFHPRTNLRVRASRIRVDRGLWFIGKRSEQTSGRISGRVQVSGYGEALRLRGSCEGRNLAAYGFPLGAAHSSLIANANLRSMSWDLAFPSIRSNIGVGRVEGHMHLASARRGGVSLMSRWKARRVDVFALAERAGRGNTLARAEVSGMLTLQGKSLQSVDDLTGRFDFDIEHTTGSAIPGLIAASQLLSSVSLASQDFGAGEAKGTISKGVVAIDEFWAASKSALVRADGKMYLTSQRLDLQALIATGDYRDIAGNFAELVSANAVAAFLPASTILSVSELLSDRTVIVDVRGTVRSPIIRLRAVETFREEVARFLLREGQRLILAGSAIGAVEGATNGF